MTVFFSKTAGRVYINVVDGVPEFPLRSHGALPGKFTGFTCVHKSSLKGGFLFNINHKRYTAEMSLLFIQLSVSIEPTD